MADIISDINAELNTDPSDPLQQVAKRLNSASDQLTSRIGAEEEILKKMNLGVQCWIMLGGKIDPTTTIRFKLGYTNEYGKWGLHLQQVKDGEEEIMMMWPLREAPRNLRLYGLKHMGELREAMLKTAISLTSRIEKFLAGDDNG